MTTAQAGPGAPSIRLRRGASICSCRCTRPVDGPANPSRASVAPSPLRTSLLARSSQAYCLQSVGKSRRLKYREIVRCLTVKLMAAQESDFSLNVDGPETHCVARVNLRTQHAID